MQMDYNPATRAFIIRVPSRDGAVIQALREEHGLDVSTSASGGGTAVLFTMEPYAAVSFYEIATPAAQAALIGLQSQIEKSWAKESTAHIDVPDGEELAPFQIAGVDYARDRKNTLFGDVPGLGKTPEAICYANEIQAQRILCIVPANIRLQWVKNIRRWTTMRWPYIVYAILHGRHGVHPTANWTVVSYDLARTEAIGRALAKGTYDLLICDELHYCKEIEALRTRAIFGGGEDRLFEALASRCERIVGLTGTPLPNRPREAYVAARGLCFDAIDFMSEDNFRERFNPSMKRQGEREDGTLYSYIDERTGRHGELQSRLRSNFMVRREKYGPNGVGYQLGMVNMPQFEIVHVEETGAVKAALKAESLLDIDPENLEGADIAVMGEVSTVRRLMGLAIAPLAVDYINMLIDGGEDKLLVFAWHKQVLDILEDKLGKHGFLRIDGGTSQNQKQARVERFKNDRSIKIMGGNMQAMGTGTDELQLVCNHAVFAEADWVPGNNQQAVDRLDRGGQLFQVQADFLVARNSFSEKVLASALRKNATTHKALDRRIMAA